MDPTSHDPAISILHADEAKFRAQMQELATAFAKEAVPFAEKLVDAAAAETIALKPAVLTGLPVSDVQALKRAVSSVRERVAAELPELLLKDGDWPHTRDLEAWQVEEKQVLLHYRSNPSDSPGVPAALTGVVRRFVGQLGPLFKARGFVAAHGATMFREYPAGPMEYQGDVNWPAQPAKTMRDYTAKHRILADLVRRRLELEAKRTAAEAEKLWDSAEG